MKRWRSVSKCTAYILIGCILLGQAVQVQAEEYVQSESISFEDLSGSSEENTENIGETGENQNSQEEQKIDTDFAGGDGSEENPYQINTAEMFRKMTDYQEKYFILMSDLDLTDSERIDFDGVLNGNGYTIKTGFSEETGMFNQLGESAVVTDCNIDIGRGYYSSLPMEMFGGVAISNHGLIRRCIVTGSVSCSTLIGKTGPIQIGSICAANSGKVEKCRSDVDYTIHVDISARFMLSGICSFGNASQCLNTGNINVEIQRNMPNMGYFHNLVSGISSLPTYSVEECADIGNITLNFSSSLTGSGAVQNYAGFIESDEFKAYGAIVPSFLSGKNSCYIGEDVSFSFRTYNLGSGGGVNSKSIVLYADDVKDTQVKTEEQIMEWWDGVLEDTPVEPPAYKDETLQFTLENEKEVIVGEGTILSGAFSYGNPETLESALKGIEWKSSDDNIVKIGNFSYVMSSDPEIGNASLLLNVEAVNPGEAVITGTTKDGKTVNCRIKSVKGPEEPDTSVDDSIIEEVKKYTTDELYAQFDAIMNSNAENEEKFRRLDELFHNEGITDIKEGIDYLSETSEYRSDYLYLTTDQIYCAFNFWDWLYTPLGTLARGTLYADGLIFNLEALSYLDLSTYTESDYPGVKKNKQMLKEFMEASEENFISDSFDYGNKTADFLKNIISLNEMVVSDECEVFMDQIINCTSEEELEKLQKQFVYNFIMPQVEASGTDRIYLNGDMFAKALGTASSILSFSGGVADDIIAMIDLNNQIAMYEKYSRFLTTIYENTDVSFEMRLAAYLLLDEIDNGCFNRIRALLSDCITFGTGMMYTDKSMIETFLQESGFGGSGTLMSAVSVLNLATFISNIVVDTGDFVKQAAYTQGYAELSALYSLKLQEDKEAFQRNQSVENAWTFFEDYTILWNLRYHGEQQYLKMNEIKMYLFANVKTFKYDLKEEIVNNTLERLEKSRFEMSGQIEIPESVQYVKKSVVNCPVDVDIYTKDGTLVATLEDGIESDITNEYGRFAVVRQAYSGDYAKVICQSTDEELVYRIKAVDDGLVNYELADGKKVYTFNNVKVQDNTKIEVTASGYGVDYDGDGKTDLNGKFVIKDPEQYVKVISMKTDVDQGEVCVGDSLTVRVAFQPENATNTALDWISLDEDIAVVNNGVITGVAEGQTTIVVRATDAAGVSIEIPVKVVPASVYVKGDVDGNGKVDIADLRLVLRAVCGKVELTDAQTSVADVETDGKVDIQDLRKILRFVCGKIDTL